MKRVALFLALLLPSTMTPGLRATELGDPAPPLAISQWVKGKEVDLKAGKDKNVYVVEFWATWCGPCRTSIPHLTDLQKEFKDQNVVFVGVSDEEASTVTPFVEKMGDKMAYVVAVDAGRKTAKAYMEAFGVQGIPHAFVVDKSGALVWHGHPMAGLDKVLKQVLAGTFDVQAAKKAAKAEAAAQEYFAAAAGGGNADKAAELGERVVKDGGGDAMLMNEFAWRLLTDPGIRNRDLKLAMRAAKAAQDASGGKEPAVLDTYARALFDTGKKADALRYQEEAVRLCTEEAMKVELEKTLKRYRAALAEK